MTAKSPMRRCAPSWPAKSPPSLKPLQQAAADRRQQKAFRDPGGGGQRHRQDHHHRQAGQAPGRAKATKSCWRQATPSAPPPSSSWASGPSARGAGFVSGKAGGDAAGLAFEALEKARGRRQRYSSDRYGRTAAEQGRPDGRTGKDRPRDQEAAMPPRRMPCCWCWMPPPARTRSPRSRPSRRPCRSPA